MLKSEAWEVMRLEVSLNLKITVLEFCLLRFPSFLMMAFGVLYLLLCL